MPAGNKQGSLSDTGDRVLSLAQERAGARRGFGMRAPLSSGEPEVRVSRPSFARARLEIS